jgi:hypothetical protein
VELGNFQQLKKIGGRWFLFTMILLSFACTPAFAQGSSPMVQDDKDSKETSASLDGAIRGTVTDMADAPIPRATIVLRGSDPGDVHTTQTNDYGYFELLGLTAGHAYDLSIHADGFGTWESSSIVLEPGQSQIIDSSLQIEAVSTNITVTPDSEQIAAEQVKAQEAQRGFLIIPNFFAAYDPNAQPLTPKLKFSLALRVARDPFTLSGVAFLAGIRQASNHPLFGEGAQGYAERLGAGYADAFSDIMLEGAILPAVFKQDPRYYYQGTGSKASRALHVITSLVVAKGDNGRWQPNYSSVGGNFASAALANLYYPKANRGAGLVLQTVAVNTAVHVAVRMAGEFVFHPKSAPGGKIWNSNPHL